MSRQRRLDKAAADNLGLSVDQYLAKFAPWRSRRTVPMAKRINGSTKRRGNPKIKPSMRVQVFERDQGLCRYCGVELEVDEFSPRMFTVDHVIPWSRGGSKQLDNLVAACNGCNQRKADRTLEEASMRLLPIGTRQEPKPERVYKSARKAHTRGHWTSSGKAKLSWTKDEAIELAANLAERDRMTMEAFPCPECDAWHLRILPGWSKLKYRRDNDYHDSFTEIGDRATGCLRYENMGKAKERRHAIYERAQAALKKVARGW